MHPEKCLLWLACFACCTTSFFFGPVRAPLPPLPTPLVLDITDFLGWKSRIALLQCHASGLDGQTCGELTALLLFGTIHHHDKATYYSTRSAQSAHSTHTPYTPSMTEYSVRLLRTIYSVLRTRTPYMLSLRSTRRSSAASLHSPRGHPPGSCILLHSMS